MTSNVSLRYTKQMNFIDFIDNVAQPMAKKGAWQIAHDLMYEEQPYSDPDAERKYYKIDDVAILYDDPYEYRGLAPRVRELLTKQIADDLAGRFSQIIVADVCPFSEAERDAGIPGDIVYNTPVKLRATGENEFLQFVFTADLNLVDPDQPLWKNASVEINYVKVPENNG